MKRFIALALVLMIGMTALPAGADGAFDVYSGLYNMNADELLFARGLSYALFQGKIDGGEGPTSIAGSGIGIYLPNPAVQVGGRMFAENITIGGLVNQEDYLSATVVTEENSEFVYLYYLLLLGWGYTEYGESDNDTIRMVRNGQVYVTIEITDSRTAVITAATDPDRAESR